MYGRRARLGVIVPSTNTTVEPEFAAHVPRDVAVLATRVPVAEVAAEQDKVASLLAMHDHVERAAAELAGAGVAAIAFACTSGSFLGGRDPDQVMCDELTRRHGLPVVTTSSALVAALAALAARRLAVATPYVTSVADGAHSYLVQAGFDVVSRHDLRILSNLDKGRLEPTESYLAARELDVTDADAVVISCTNWRTLDSLAAVEADTGRPAVSSNLATLWALLRLAGVEEPFSPGTALTRAGLPDDARAQWSARTAVGVVTGG